MMVVALILMFRSISTCCPFSVCVCVCYGAGVMQGLHPYWLANAWINSSSSTNIWKVWSPMVTLNTVLPTGRACVLSSVSTVASWILIIPFSLVLLLFLMSVLYQTRHPLSSLLITPSWAILGFGSSEVVLLYLEGRHSENLALVIPHHRQVPILFNPPVTMVQLPITALQRPPVGWVISVINHDVADTQYDFWCLHCVTLCSSVVVVCHDCIIPSRSSIVKAKIRSCPTLETWNYCKATAQPLPLLLPCWLRVVFPLCYPLFLVVSCTCIIPSDWYLVKPTGTRWFVPKWAYHPIVQEWYHQGMWCCSGCNWWSEWWSLCLPCCFVYPHYTYIIGICKGPSLVIPELSQSSCKSLLYMGLRRKSGC